MDQQTIQELSSARRDQECLQACQQLLKSEPENPLPWKYGGKSLLALKHFEKAIQYLAKAHQLDNKDPEILKDLGNIYNALQNDTEAIKLYQAALLINENYAPALNNLGLINQRHGNLNTAEELVKKARDFDKSFAPYHINLGGIYKDLGKFDLALTSTLKSLELQPDNPTALMNLGSIYEALGDLDQALAATLKSLELQPDNDTALMNLGGIYQELGDLDQALATTLKSLNLKPDNPATHIKLGSIYRNLGNHKQALASTLKSLELKPGNDIAYINLGAIYKELGMIDQALVATLKSLELNPNNPSSLINLGSIYQDLGDLDQALATTLKSLELQPDNPTALMNLGNIHRNLGNLDQALASTLKSLEFEPDSTTLLNLSNIHEELGNIHEARTCLIEAMKSEKSKEEATIKLARNYYLTGNYREGINTVRDTQNKEGGNLLLSLYLCMNEKIEFIRCAENLARKRWLNPQGIAAIDHANILYNENLDNGLSGRSTIDSIDVQQINKQEFPDALFNEILTKALDGSLQARSQGLLINGEQTSGNILDLPEKPFQALKKLLIEKIDKYNKSLGINSDSNFQDNLQKGLYQLRGWAIIMNKGGSLKSHNHEAGWLTGTFYLQMPEDTSKTNEGAIEFCHQGPKYPPGKATFKKRIIRPKERDLNIFHSSLFHRTLAFQSEKKRVCIAFDVTNK